MSESAIFWWWDDAVRVANERAKASGVRWRVKGFQGLWRISAEGSPEVCS